MSRRKYCLFSVKKQTLNKCWGDIYIEENWHIHACVARQKKKKKKETMLSYCRYREHEWVGGGWVSKRDMERAMDGWSAKVSCQAICVRELMTQRLRDMKPLSCPWWLSPRQALSLKRTETFRICSLPTPWHKTTNCPFQRHIMNWLMVHHRSCIVLLYPLLYFINCHLSIAVLVITCTMTSHPARLLPGTNFWVMGRINLNKLVSVAPLPILQVFGWHARFIS